MKQEIKSTYLCLLDNLNLKRALTLGKFSLRKYDINELSGLLQGRDDCYMSKEYREQMELYAKFPWASLEKVYYPKDSTEACFIVRTALYWGHGGKSSWYPFEEHIRTLNLLKQSPGPVFGRQFYHRPIPYIQTSAQIKKVIYSEPYSVPQIDLNGNPFTDILAEYDFGPKDLSGFKNLKQQLKKCLEKDSRNNCHLKIAIHHFENADRKLRPKPIAGSFKAIEPLIDYEASLEGLMIPETDKGKTCEKLSSRVSSIIKDKSDEIKNFIKKVFWLRSKFAHGSRSVEDIEKDIVIRRCANKGVKDQIRGISIPSGNYTDLLLKEGIYFPGFLTNLREVCRLCIRFFCEEYVKGYTRDEIINKIDENIKKQN